MHQKRLGTTALDISHQRVSLQLGNGVAVKDELFLLMEDLIMCFVECRLIKTHRIKNCLANKLFGVL